MVEANKKTNNTSAGAGPSKREQMRQSVEAARTRSRQWLASMVAGGEFFGVCEEHKSLRKSEVNVYCVDCRRRMCAHCIPMAGSCPHECLLQIRRYIYQDVVRVADMQKLVSCSDVQPCIVNGAKVVLLKPRKTSKPSRSPSGCPACELSGRSFSDGNRYCSIFCKVKDDISAVHSVDDDASRPSLPDRTAAVLDASAPTKPSSELPPRPPQGRKSERDRSRRIPVPPFVKGYRDRKGSPPHRSRLHLARSKKQFILLAQ